MGSLLRLREPYRPAIVKVGRARVGAASEGCGCAQSSVEVFKALDMLHAAGMHVAGEGRASWSIPDWSLHLDEEEGKFFEALRAIAAKMPAHSREHLDGEVDQLVAEHDVVRDGLARGVLPADDVARAHGDREDALVRRYHSQLMAYAAWRKRTRVGGDPLDGLMMSKSYTDTIDPHAGMTLLSIPPSPYRYPDVPFPFPQWWTTAAEAAAYSEEIKQPEKFADPFYLDCLKGAGAAPGSGTPYVAGPGSAEYWGWPARGYNGLGYEYLGGVRKNATARVAAMRAKIVENGAAASHQVDTMADVSLEGMRKFGLDIARRYREAKAAADAGDASQIAALAKENGLPVDGFLSDYKKIDDLLNRYSPGAAEFLPELWRSFSPQMLAVARAVADKVKTLITGSGTEMSTSLADSLASAAGVVPVAGQFVNIVIKLYSADMAARAAAAEAECQKSNNITAAYVKKTVGLNLPVPLHLSEAFPNMFSCDDAPSRFAAQSVLGTNLRCMVGEKLGLVNVDGIDWGRTWDEVPGMALPWGDQEIIGWWWGLASSMMSSPAVEPVFRAMNRDVNGGAFASDEQVMLVAAPIAVAYGLDVDKFAVALWNESPGWRSRPDLFEPFTYSTIDNPSICTTEAVNAMQIQWAVLAHTAFDIAEAAKAGKRPELRSGRCPGPLCIEVMVGPASGVGSSAPILTLGAVASGGLYLAGMSIGIVLAPLAAAIAYVAWRK